MKREPRHSLFWTIAGLFVLVAVVGTLLQALVAVAVLGPLSQTEDRSRVQVALNGLISELSSALPASPASVFSAFFFDFFDRWSSIHVHPLVSAAP